MKLITVFLYTTLARKPHVGISFEPRFECDRRCMNRIGSIFSHTLKNVNLDEVEGIQSGRHRRDATATESDRVCIEDVKRIEWRTFVEVDLCAIVKQYLPPPHPL